MTLSAMPHQVLSGGRVPCVIRVFTGVRVQYAGLDPNWRSRCSRFSVATCSPVPLATGAAQCPIHIERTLNDQTVRRALDLTSWEAASIKIRAWEATGKMGGDEPKRVTARATTSSKQIAICPGPSREIRNGGHDMPVRSREILRGGRDIPPTISRDPKRRSRHARSISRHLPRRSRDTPDHLATSETEIATCSFDLATSFEEVARYPRPSRDIRNGDRDVLRAGRHMQIGRAQGRERG